MGVRIYPVTPVAPACEDYSVKVNGAVVRTDTARVSAIPFNRRWPGHQRDVSQSEAVQFLSLATDEPLEFEITPQHPFETVAIRPASLGITPRVTPEGSVCFRLEHPAYFTVEAYGRNRALHILADPMPAYDVDPDDASVIYFGAGEHDVGEIVLKSGQTLFLDEGAVVYASVLAERAEHIRILGRGILDNSRNRERILFPVNAEDNHSAVQNAERNHTVTLSLCDDVEIDGITIRDSLVYNISPTVCRNIRIHNVKIIGCWRYNSDGIDLHNCEDVHISDCFLRTFDDSICLKGDMAKLDEITGVRPGDEPRANEWRHDSFRNVLVENCVIWNDWGRCLEIGAETCAEEICDAVFRDCKLIHITHAPLDCTNVDYADVHGLRFENIEIELDEVIPQPMIQRSDNQVYRQEDRDYVPEMFCARVIFHYEYSAGRPRRGRNRDIVFDNVHVLGRQKVWASFLGYDANSMTEDILLSNLYQNGEALASLEISQNEFTRNIRFQPAKDRYAQMKKNTVKAADQLKDSGYLRFDCEPEGKRILLLGNSITLHGCAPKIGWLGEWGMAASAPEKDYVHRLMALVRAERPASFCVCQVSQWEKDYPIGDTLLERYADARAFGADVIVFRAIENCPAKDFDPSLFRTRLGELLDYFGAREGAEVIFTTGFWRHPGDAVIEAVAKERGWALVRLGDLGEADEMKALGLFEHRGVANHPGDLGMEQIAARIYAELKQSL